MRLSSVSAAGPAPSSLSASAICTHETTYIQESSGQSLNEIDRLHVTVWDNSICCDAMSAAGS